MEKFTMTEAEHDKLMQEMSCAADGFDVWFKTLSERDQRAVQEEIWAQTIWPTGEPGLVEIE